MLKSDKCEWKEQTIDFLYFIQKIVNSFHSPPPPIVRNCSLFNEYSIENLILGDIFIRPQQILCFLDFSGRKFYYKKKIYAFSTDKKKINILNSVYVHALKRKQSAK